MLRTNIRKVNRIGGKRVGLGKSRMVQPLRFMFDRPTMDHSKTIKNPKNKLAKRFDENYRLIFDIPTVNNERNQRRYYSSGPESKYQSTRFNRMLENKPVRYVAIYSFGLYIIGFVYWLFVFGDLLYVFGLASYSNTDKRLDPEYWVAVSNIMDPAKRHNTPEIAKLLETANVTDEPTKIA